MMYHRGLDVVWVGLSLKIMEYLETQGFVHYDDLPERPGGYRPVRPNNKTYWRLVALAHAWRNSQNRRENVL